MSCKSMVRVPFARLITGPATSGAVIASTLPCTTFTIERERLVFETGGDVFRDDCSILTIGVLARPKDIEVAKRDSFQVV
jgi:hypothetical protein